MLQKEYEIATSDVENLKGQVKDWKEKHKEKEKEVKDWNANAK